MIVEAGALVLKGKGWRSGPSSLDLGVFQGLVALSRRLDLMFSQVLSRRLVG